MVSLAQMPLTSRKRKIERAITRAKKDIRASRKDPVPEKAGPEAEAWFKRECKRRYTVPAYLNFRVDVYEIVDREDRGE
jgi:hypothetical protein